MFDRMAVGVVLGGVCGVGMTVLGALALGTRTQPATTPTLHNVVETQTDGGMTDGQPEADKNSSLVSSSSSISGRLAGDKKIGSSLSGVPSPWQWRRWAHLRPGITRAEVEAILDAPTSQGHHKSYWYYRKPPTAKTSQKWYVVSFYYDKLSKWSVPHLPTGQHDLKRYGDLAMWDRLIPLSSSLDDVLAVLGEPTWFQGNQDRFIFAYQMPSGTVGKAVFTIKKTGECELSTIEKPY